MSKTRLRAVLILVIAIVVFVSLIIGLENRSANGFAKGDGTLDNPYQISSDKELIFLAECINHEDEEVYKKYYDANYILTKNINLKKKNWTPIGYVAYDVLGINDYENEEVGRSFQGILDGNGKRIDNLKIYIKGEQNLETLSFGLFGHIAKNATIKNLSINVNVDTTVFTQGYIGGLAGFVRNSTIENVHVSYEAKIEGLSQSTFVAAGGLIGMSMCNSINNCSTNSLINSLSTEDHGNFRLGGFIGDSKQGTIQRSSVTGQIEFNVDIGASVKAGGFIGESGYSIINDCYSLTNISGELTKILENTKYENSKYQFIAGFIAYCYEDKYKNCYAAGNVSGIDTIGGFVGTIVSQELSLNEIVPYFSNCFYSNENIESNDIVVLLSEADTNNALTKMKTEDMKNYEFANRLNQESTKKLWEQQNDKNFGFPYINA